MVVRDQKPWFLVEVKTADTRLAASLEYYQKETKLYAFQAVLDSDPVDADCFSRTDPLVVSLRLLRRSSCELDATCATCARGQRRVGDTPRGPVRNYRTAGSAARAGRPARGSMGGLRPPR